MTNTRYARLYSNLSHSVGENLIKELKDRKRLDKVTLKAFFAHCPLSNVELDHYILASDTLIELLVLDHRHTIESLSLRGCTSLTDVAVNFIRGNGTGVAWHWFVI